LPNEGWLAIGGRAIPHTEGFGDVSK